LHDRDQFGRMAGKASVELGRAIARLAVLNTAVEHQFVAGKSVQEILFGEPAPLAGRGVFKLPTSSVELLEDQETCRPNSDVRSSAQHIQ
jgi:hypothetical protein